MNDCIASAVKCKANSQNDYQFDKIDFLFSLYFIQVHINASYHGIEYLRGKEQKYNRSRINVFGQKDFQNEFYWKCRCRDNGCKHRHIIEHFSMFFFITDAAERII